ncbi:hypothetical protein CIB48_g10993 [Xylaria polymorpha]|nr:hypothetical protein CIB48_g10993 [Xylaria polymorpha]
MDGDRNNFLTYSIIAVFQPRHIKSNIVKGLPLPDLLLACVEVSVLVTGIFVRALKLRCPGPDLTVQVGAKHGPRHVRPSHDDTAGAAPAAGAPPHNAGDPVLHRPLGFLRRSTDAGDCGTGAAQPRDYAPIVQITDQPTR